MPYICRYSGPFLPAIRCGLRTKIYTSRDVGIIIYTNRLGLTLYIGAHECSHIDNIYLRTGSIYYLWFPVLEVMTCIGSSKVELIPNIAVGVAESSDTLQ